MRKYERVKAQELIAEAHTLLEDGVEKADYIKVLDKLTESIGFMRERLRKRYPDWDRYVRKKKRKGRC